MINPSELNLSTLPFVSLENRSQLPSIPCIYFAIDSFGAVQYIGRTINLNQRWIQHHRRDQLSKIESVRISYLLADVDLLPSIESALIQWFRPRLNLISYGRGLESFTSRIVTVPGLSKRLKELWASGGKAGCNRFSVRKVSQHLDLTQHSWKRLLEGGTGDNIPIDLLRKIEGFFSVDFGVTFND